MDFFTVLLSLLFPFLWAFLHILISNKISRSSKHLPPGPSPLPVIGNILDLGNNPHQSLTNLSKRYGPIMTLKLGTITTIVISTVAMAKEVLHTNDLVFSSRTVPDSVSSLGHDRVSVVWISASAKWRSLRRACSTELFSPKRLDSTQSLRQKKMQELLDVVEGRCKKGEAVDIGKAAFTTALNSISNTFFSMDLAYYSSDRAQEFKDTIWGIMEEAGRPNIVDYFPVFRGLDPQGVRARMDYYFGKLLKFFDGIVEEKLRLRSLKAESEITNDVMDSFLNLLINSQLTREEVLHLFLDLFAAGIDTTSSTVEWAMAELIHNPEKLVKTKQELQHVIGKNGKLEESRISELPYLNAVVKETLRLHPPVPFLIPRKSDNDVQVGGFVVPKNSQILVNVWAMGRDSRVWKEPDSFEPERFMEGHDHHKVDFKGRDFEFIPFGAGRRICPGLPLANRSVHLMLVALLNHFDWILEDDLKPKEMDMSDKFGLTLKKSQPLRAVPTKLRT
ncbi:geraniol 8-hydroxylase-like [Neltuma alba]|uniref:geraniol 8-hydroxylase-like n=1 Tax=Neltuma alba TaxID=207710 RepID=UPI0010A5850B|nr:geraniol 8-hydroxylase-like [Prosopis alba]